MMAVDPLLGFTSDAVRFERLLGKGAMGAVYQGTQLGLERPVAIKVIAPHLLEDPAYIARFEREAQTIGKLLHPNIIACHDFGPTPGPRGETLYLMVLEYVDGWSLGELLRTKRLSVRQVLELHRQAAEGLAAAHRVGIVHRDIKPDNIMVTRQGQAKLADFGLARQLSQDSELTAVGTILGSPAFMSPETCRGLEPTAESDTYSLGCSLVQSLTGVATYPGASALTVMQDHITAPIPRLADRRRDLAMLQPLIDRALAKDPAQRYRSVQQFGKELAEAAATTPRDLFAGSITPLAGSKGQGAVAPQVQLGQSSMLATLSTNHVRSISSSKRLRYGLLGVAGMAIILTLFARSALHQSATVVPVPTAAAGDGVAINAPAPASAPVTPAAAAVADAAAPAPAAVQPADELDTTDSATLDQAEGLITSGKLDEAQALIADLVLAGELKQRRKTMLDAIATAWTSAQQATSAQLQAASALLASNPQSALDTLQGLVIAPRFPDLESRRLQLMTDARAVLHQPPAAPAVMAAAPAKETLPSAGDDTQVQLLHDEQFTNTMLLNAVPISRGDSRLGFGVPWGGQTLYASVRPPLARNAAHQIIIIHLPKSPDLVSQGLLLVVHGSKPGVLSFSRHLQGERNTRLGTVALTGTTWQTIPLQLGAPSHGDLYISMWTSSTVDNQSPFYLAAAAVGTGVMPTYAQLKLVPGTLLADEQLQDAFDTIHVRSRAFPRYDAVAIALPKHPFQEDAGLTSAQADAVHLGLCGPDASALAPAPAAISYYDDPQHQAAAVNRAPGLRHTDFYIHVLDTTHAPQVLPALLGGPFRQAISDGLLPVVVLGDEDWQDAAVHALWLRFVTLLRQQVPGLPIIDLAQVPLEYRSHASPIDCATASGRHLVDQGLAGGLAELRARINFILGRP